MKKRKALAMLMALTMTASSLAACGKTIEEPAPAAPTEAAGTESGNAETGEAPTQTTAAVEADALTFEEGTVLRMATGYNSAKTGLFFDAETAGEGVTLADGKTYHTDDLKPTWVEVQNRLGMKFENKYQGNTAAKEFEYWKEQLDQVDMISGTASLLTDYGENGSIVNLADYLDKMPNFNAYLQANPIVRLSITGNVDTGAIYFSPYFDGVNDIEKMPLMRTDWVVKLLDGEGEFTAEASNKLNAAVYEPYMPTSGSVTVEVVKKDGTAAEKIQKNYDAAGNIVQKMNDALASGSVDGVEAVNMLRTYIDTAYNGYYGTERSDLFVGQNAAWDADELVALLRCVVANPQTLNGTDGKASTLTKKSKDKDGNEVVTEVSVPSIVGIFTREDANNQRRADMKRLAGVLFGARGLESRQDYLYVGNDGQLHDARQEAATYEALNRMHQLVEEGLVSDAFVKGQDVNTKQYLENDMGFFLYDYNQTQTVYNEDGKTLDTAAGEKFMAVMVPVARWDDGEGEKIMRFTESWRSVKTDGWGITVAGAGNDENKLNAALKLIDYAYSKEGQILMSYGPDAFINTNPDGSYINFNFNGEEWPEIADATRAELWDKASGNYTNYARQYLGSTLSFAKSQSFEYQCTTTVGREGAGYISTAIALGTIVHPELDIASNQWYTSVPTVLPTTKADTDLINGLTDLSQSFSDAKGDDQKNVLTDIIVNGFTADGFKSVDESVETVKTKWNGAAYLQTKETQWEELQDFYAEQ